MLKKILFEICSSLEDNNNYENEIVQIKVDLYV